MKRIGYCCINLSIGEKFRTMQLTWANRNKKEDVENKWNIIVNHNFALLCKIINWNIQNNIWLYRISSDLVPFADHETWGYLWDNWRNSIHNYGAIGPARKMVQEYIDNGGRFTVHPGQFVSIGSANENTRNNSIKNLEYHGQLFSLLGLPQNYSCPINIHVSNGTKDCQITANFVTDSLSKLSQQVTNRLVFENEQNGCWTPENLNKHFPNNPITFDYHHYNLNPDSLGIDRAVELAAKSWPNNDPVQHYSEGRKSPRDPAHSDYIESLPLTQYDIEVEAKMKEKSILLFITGKDLTPA
jgi:UV DNA damage endonuclease